VLRSGEKEKGGQSFAGRFDIRKEAQK